MITNELELQGTQERIAFFYRTIANIRAQAVSPEEYRLYSNSYLVELEKMNNEIIEYLKLHPSESNLAKAA